MQESPLCSFEVHNEATGVIPKPPDVFLMSVPIVIIVKLPGGCLARCHNNAPLMISSVSARADYDNGATLQDPARSRRCGGLAHRRLAAVARPARTRRVGVGPRTPWGRPRYRTLYRAYVDTDDF